MRIRLRRSGAQLTAFVSFRIRVVDEIRMKPSKSHLPRLRRQFESLGLIRVFYKNWLVIIVNWVVRRPTARLVTRQGWVISGRAADFVTLALLDSRGWKISSYDGEHITFTSTRESLRIKCRCRNGADVAHLAEVFISRVYGHGLNKGTVIDIGMSSGESAIYFASLGAKLVIGLEPFTESYEMAIENIKLNNMDAKILPLHMALSSKDGDADLNIARKFPNVNSLALRPAISRVSFDSMENVRTIRLETLFARQMVSRVDLLKLDCEGCEYDCISSESLEALKSVDEIIIEFHNGVGNLLDVLKSAGFELTYDCGKTIGIIHGRRTARSQSSTC